MGCHCLIYLADDSALRGAQGEMALAAGRNRLTGFVLLVVLLPRCLNGERLLVDSHG